MILTKKSPTHVVSDAKPDDRVRRSRLRKGRRHSDDLLQSLITRKLLRHVGRLRLNASHQGANSRFIKNQKQMEAILTRKKIRRCNAERAIVETLNFAASHRLNSMRRDEWLEEMIRAETRLDQLIILIEKFEKVVSELPQSQEASSMMSSSSRTLRISTRKPSRILCILQ
jgi:hypothetical protein